MKRIVSGTVLTFLLIGMLTLAFNIQPVKAEGTIYIRADGSVDPPTAPIFTLDNVTYTFTDNIYDSIVIQRNFIVVDGAGYVVQGFASGVGVDLSGRIWVTIMNMEIRFFKMGIKLLNSQNNIIYGNNITLDISYGIYLYSGSGNLVSANNITVNSVGVMLGGSDNILSGNNITGNGVGVELGGYSNILSGNIMNDNVYNLDVGAGPLCWTNSIGVSNLVNGKPVYYLVNQKDLVINPVTYPQIGYLALINCVNITVEGQPLVNNGQGLLLVKTTNSKIAGNTITNNIDGVHLWYSENNSLIGNNITNNSNVIIARRGWGGVYLDNYSDNTVICKNNIASNGEYGIYAHESRNNTILENNIANNGGGVLLASGVYSFDNVSRNNITNNGGYGIYLIPMRPHKYLIYHNNFINNTVQAYTLSARAYWDDGYPSGGNYWSDYSGIDVKNGPAQDLPGSDGLGDTPYIIDADNIDHFPLMNSYGAPPPLTYVLTITTTVGGTTNPALGTYSYTANSYVQVTAIPYADYIFDHWKLDNLNVGSANPYSVLMNKNHTLKAVFTPIPKPPVGGYSLQIEGSTASNPLPSYLALIAILTIGFTATRRKTHREIK